MYKEKTEGNGQVKIGVYICHCGVKLIFFALKMSKKLIISIFAFSILSFSQENIESRDSTKKQISLPRFDIHLGAGWVSGGRLGVRVLFSENFSAELSYGLDFRNFIAAADLEKRYGFGINWHVPKTSCFVISMLSSYNERVYQDNRSINISLNVGFLELKTNDIRIFGRIGFYGQFKKWWNMKEYKLKEIGPNLDFGIRWCFDFNK